METVFAAVLGYLLGSLPTAYLVVKLKTGKNIWEVGSKNVGGLNVKRATGSWGLAAITILVDFAKAWLAIYLASIYFPEWLVIVPAFVALGHNFPVWTGLRGGRGIGVLLASAVYLDPAYAFTWLAIWAIGYLVTGYIAGGAMSALVFTPAVESLLGYTVNPAVLLASIIVFAKYREKADLIVSGKLPKHFWGEKK